MSILETVLSKFEEDIKNNSDPNLQSIADYLLEKAEESGSGLIERLLEKEKSLSNCLNYILKKTFTQITKGGTERPKGNHVVSAVRSEVVYEWALEYYRSEETEVTFDPMSMMPKPPTPKINASVPTKKNQPQKKPQNLVSFPSLFDLAENSAGQEISAQKPDESEAVECNEGEEEVLDEDETENKVGDDLDDAEECIQPTEQPVCSISSDQTFVLNPPRSGQIPAAVPAVEKAPELKVIKPEFAKLPEPAEPTGELFTNIPASVVEQKKRNKHIMV